MRTHICILLVLVAAPLLAQQGTSMRATNGIGYGTTVINSLVGKIATGNVTNAGGSRVAYLEDVTGATNGILSTITNISAHQANLATNTYAPTVTNIANYLFTFYGLQTNQFETLQTDGATNFTIPATYTFGTVYKKIVATNDIAFTNVSGVGSASVRILPNGSDRWVYGPTNWAWLETNNFVLNGTQWKIGLTNGASRIGWLSIVADGTSPTNVGAKWIATP